MDKEEEFAQRIEEVLEAFRERVVKEHGEPTYLLVEAVNNFSNIDAIFVELIHKFHLPVALLEGVHEAHKRAIMAWGQAVGMNGLLVMKLSKEMAAVCGKQMEVLDD